MDVKLDELRAAADTTLPGFDYPISRHPWYLHQERTDDPADLLPIARHLVTKRYGRNALAVEPDDQLLIVTYPHQNEVVFDVMQRALLEAGATSVDRLDLGDLGEVEEYSAADGWREITDRLAPMIESGVQFTADAARIHEFMQDRPGFTGVFAAEAGRGHLRRATSQKFRNNWLYSSYEDLVSRANAFPDELWRAIDWGVVRGLRDAAAVRITSPEGTDIGWEVTEQQAALWPEGAYVAGHIFGSTIQGIRRGHKVETYIEEAKALYPTLNGVVAGTSNHTGYYPHIEVHVEEGMISRIDGGGRYGDLWREVVDRYADVRYPGYPRKGWAWFNDASIGTNPKSYRQIETLWSYNYSWTNLPERAQAGVVHFGFGAEHWDPTFLEFAREHRVPTMHFPHVHNMFATFEIKRRSTGAWEKLIDKGRLAILDDPDIVRLANAIGSPALLEYDWIPALPGINYPGDYQRDYARDPVAWIRREQQGEFAPRGAAA